MHADCKLIRREKTAAPLSVLLAPAPATARQDKCPGLLPTSLLGWSLSYASQQFFPFPLSLM